MIKLIYRDMKFHDNYWLTLGQASQGFGLRDRNFLGMDKSRSRIEMCQTGHTGRRTKAVHD